MADSPLTARVNAEITAAMKAQQAGRLGTLRLIKAAIMNRGVEKNRDLDDAEVLQVIGQLVKQRRDSIEQFAAAGRQDLVDKETAEVAILDEYLPPPASAAEVEAAVAEAVVETGATSPKEMGKVMKAVMVKLAGKTADGKVVSEAVKARLAAL
ncbi:MAG: GatB/YqeY domain-containing protein [Vicinamibacterales bacterium]